MQQRQWTSLSRRATLVALTAALIATVVASMPVHVHAEASQEHAGSAVDALPGVHEVPLAVRAPDAWAARLGLGYGWTESVLGEDDTHHRLQLDAAGSVSPSDWLSFSIRALGRYDIHSGDESDSGGVTETHAGARAVFPLGKDWNAGAELSLWLPGGDTVGKAFAAVSGDLSFLIAYAPELSPLSVGLSLGLRSDRSKFSGGDPDKYSSADRLGLGVSDAIWGLREGLAFSYRAGSIEWIAEWAFRMYFKQVAESPMWIRAGARYRPCPPLQLELILGVSPSKRPSLDEGAPLAVVEPRLEAGLSITYAWLNASQPTAAAAPPREAPPPPVSKPLAKLRGVVLTPSGTGLSGATLTLEGGASKTATTDAQGAFALEALPEGSYSLRTTAPDFEADTQSLELHDGDAPELRITLKRELPQGQIRGTVRRFNGQPIVASISIPSLNITQETRADGSFEIDVPPGDYSLKVKAKGFRPQTRKARVEQRGVAILIVELEVQK